MRNWFLLTLICVSLLSAKPTVSVLYFENRSDDTVSSNFSKALSDVVSVALAGAESFDLIEREELEKVIGEQEFSQSALVDPATAVRMGKILGATYLVNGAYFIEEGEVFVTMKLVTVDNARVAAGKRLSGKKKKLGAVIHKIAEEAAALLSEKGLVVTVTTEAESYSLSDLQEYNRSLQLRDQGKLEEARKRLKRLSMKLSYAEKTLRKVEKEIEKSIKVRDAFIDELHKGSMSYNEFMIVVTELMTGMRYREVLDLCYKARAEGIDVSGVSGINPTEIVEHYVVVTLKSLRQWEEVVTNGGAFMERYPRSLYFSAVKMSVREALQQISREKKAHSKIADLIAAIDKSSYSKDTKAYKKSELYRRENLLYDAFGLLHGINTAKVHKELTIDEDKILFEYLMTAYQLYLLDAMKKGMERMHDEFSSSPYLSALAAIENYLKTVE